MNLITNETSIQKRNRRNKIMVPIPAKIKKVVPCMNRCARVYTHIRIMKILFVMPRKYNLIVDTGFSAVSHWRFLSKIILIRKPMCFPILAALTPKKYSLELVNGGLSNINFENKYDLVGITCNTAYAFLAYEIADEFCRRGVPVVLGGYHPSALPEEAKMHADSVVIGEAEETWPQLLKDMEKGKLKPFYIQKQPVDPKLIPHPRDIYQKGTSIGIQATRGCPYGCEFCSISNMKFRRIFRMRPIKDVVEEVRSHTGKSFIFQDNSLTINPKYTKQLFREIKGMNKKFIAYGNINILGRDDELLRLASEAGCIGWLIGFESVCQKSLDSVGKKSNRVSEYLSSVKKIHDYGMIIEASFVFGFDYDTTDIFDKTDEFVRKSEVEIPFALILTPYPGTALYQRLENEGRILTKDWAKYNGIHVVFRPKNMTAEELRINTLNLDKKWHKTSPSIERILRSMNLGLYPFIETLETEIFWRLINLKSI